MNTLKIKALIVENGYTQQTFAEKLGITRQAVSRILKTKNTSTDNLLKMAQVLNVEPQILLK